MKKRTGIIILLISLVITMGNVNSEIFAQKKKASGPKKFALNFNDVEISEFITVMSQIIGKNIVLSDKVRGKISISSAKRVPVEEAYNLMKSILEVKGFAVIETPNLIKVIPIKDAVKKNVAVIVDGEKINLNKEDTITYLLELKNAEANDILNVIRPLKSAETQIVAYTTMNTIIFSGNSLEIKGLIKIAKTLDQKISELSQDDPNLLNKDGSIHVIHLENADAEKLAEVLSRIPFSDSTVINTQPLNTKQQQQPRNIKTNKQAGNTNSSSNKKKDKLSIVPNKETNSLIIKASPGEFREIHNVIKQLDTVRPQVLIEALIVEVNAESNWGFGIDWSLGGASGMHQFGGASTMGGVSSWSDSTGLGKDLVVPLSSGTFSLGYLADTSILNYVLLNASAYDQNINILSTPHILTIDNQEAEINVAEEIAIPSNTRISSDDTIYYTYDYKTVGLKLKLTPHITKGNKITMNLLVEVNSVLGDTSYTSTGTVIPPDLGKRDVKTNVSVNDGRTIVVGGLMRQQKTETETKVPFLGDIPLLGWFFKNKTQETKKTNLLIFITPKIVTDPEKLAEITAKKREEINKVKKEIK